MAEPYDNQDARASLGHFVYAFANLEVRIKTAILCALGTPLDNAALTRQYFLIGRLDSKAAVSKLRAALRQSQQASPAFLDFLKMIDKLSAHRNLILHNPNIVSEDDETLTVYTFGGSINHKSTPHTNYSEYALQAFGDLSILASRGVYQAVHQITRKEKADTDSLTKAVVALGLPHPSEVRQGTYHTQNQEQLRAYLAEAEHPQL